MEKKNNVQTGRSNPIRFRYEKDGETFNHEVSISWPFSDSYETPCDLIHLLEDDGYILEDIIDNLTYYAKSQADIELISMHKKLNGYSVIALLSNLASTNLRDFEVQHDITKVFNDIGMNPNISIFGPRQSNSPLLHAIDSYMLYRKSDPRPMGPPSP